jgi:hypothetical protein
MKLASLALVGISLFVAISPVVTPCAAMATKLLCFSTVQEVDQLVGPSFQILTRAYEELNVQIEIVPLPFGLVSFPS